MQPSIFERLKHHELLLLSLVVIVLFSATTRLFATTFLSAPATLNPDGTCLPGGCSVTVAGGSSLIGVTSTTESETWLGQDAGANGADTEKTVFVGVQAGDGAVGNVESTFIGYQAGLNSASGGGGDTFVGVYAGGSVTAGGNSVFVGRYAGTGATSSSDSIFLGYSAGAGAAEASHSIFIGSGAGNGDAINNNAVAGWNILIGNSTNTGGKQNSIAVGAGATNTEANQFLVTSTVTDFNFRGLNYTFPTAHGGAGSFLMNNGSGILTWQRQSKVLFDHYTDVGNVGGSDIDFYTDSVPANTLSSVGDKLIAHYGGTIADGGIYTIQFSFAGDTSTSCMISNAVGNGSPAWRATVSVIRVDATSVRILSDCSTDPSISGLPGPISYTTISGLDFTAPITVKLVGDMDTEAVADKVVAKISYIEFLPAAN